MSENTARAKEMMGKTLAIRSFAGVVRVRAAETRDLLTVIEHTLPPGRLAMPLHRHEREAETTYVLEGVLSVQLEKRVHRLSAGQSLVKPAGVFHTFWNESTRTVRFLEMISPGGLEAYYEELTEIVPASGTIPIERVLELSRRYGLEFDMASMLDIMERHEVQLA